MNEGGYAELTAREPKTKTGRPQHVEDSPVDIYISAVPRMIIMEATPEKFRARLQAWFVWAGEVWGGAWRDGEKSQILQRTEEVFSKYDKKEFKKMGIIIAWEGSLPNNESLIHSAAAHDMLPNEH